MINSHYRNARRSNVHLKTEFPKLMAFVESMGSLWKDFVKAHLFWDPVPTEIYAGGSRIENYGWHAYQKSKTDENREGQVAEKLAALVKDGPDSNWQGWSHEGAASELMVR